MAKAMKSSGTVSDDPHPGQVSLGGHAEHVQRRAFADKSMP